MLLDHLVRSFGAGLYDQPLPDEPLADRRRFLREGPRDISSLVAAPILLGSALAEAKKRKKKKRKLKNYPIFDNAGNPMPKKKGKGDQGLLDYVKGFDTPVLLTVGAYWCMPCYWDVESFNYLSEGSWTDHFKVVGVNILVKQKREESIRESKRKFTDRAKYPNVMIGNDHAPKLLEYIEKKVLKTDVNMNLPCHILVDNKSGDILYAQFHGVRMRSDEYFTLVRTIRDMFNF